MSRGVDIIKLNKTMRQTAVALAISAAFATAPVWAQDGLTELGALNGSTYSRAFDINADGTVVVGDANDGAAYHARRAFIWTQADGMVSLGTINEGAVSHAFGVNADGTVVVGDTFIGTPGQTSFAFRWTQAVGMVSLGTLNGGVQSGAKDVNADGTVVVGNANDGAADNAPRAFRWTEAGGMVSLGTLGGHSSSATSVNSDGSVVVGTADNSDPNYTSRAFRWTEAGGMVSLGTLNGGTSSFANGVNSDGTVVVGESAAENASRAFRWTEAGGMVSLGTLNGGTNSFADGVNSDGTVVVGVANDGNAAGDWRAFRWTAATGMKSVEDWLRANGVTVASDMTSSAFSTSADGSVVVGQLENYQAFIARVSGTGSGFITLQDVSESLGSTTMGNRLLLTTGSTAINGAHSRPLSRRVEAGQKTLWIIGDWGRDDHGSRDGEIGLAELGAGYRFNPVQLNIAVGRTSARQSMMLDGHVKADGTYLIAEAIAPLQTNEQKSGLWAIIGAYAHKGDADIRRGYLNAGSPDASTGAPDIETWGVRARLDWENAAALGNAGLSPYADLSYNRTRLDSYTESGGGFPANFDARNEHSTELRIGINSSLPISVNAKLLGTLEGTHRFEESEARTTGQIIGLFGFDLEGQKLNRNWLRIGAGVEGKLGYGVVSVSLNATTKGEMPNAWMAASYQIAF